jgi:hypothetical protein
VHDTVLIVVLTPMCTYNPPCLAVLCYCALFSRLRATQQQRAREACDRQCTLAKQQIDAAQTKVQGATATATAAGTAAATLCRATLDSASEVCHNTFYITNASTGLFCA